mmetsp:Transcript_54981/g.153326  ORF Transcript_54981/g.153326 Transcript_54981/m.153326 type:complete len:260 (-) Transcript_54981:143-922(-)
MVQHMQQSHEAKSSDMRYVLDGMPKALRIFCRYIMPTAASISQPKMPPKMAPSTSTPSQMAIAEMKVSSPSIRIESAQRIPQQQKVKTERRGVSRQSKRLCLKSPSSDSFFDPSSSSTTLAGLCFTYKNEKRAMRSAWTTMDTQMRNKAALALSAFGFSEGSCSPLFFAFPSATVLAECARASLVVSITAGEVIHSLQALAASLMRGINPGTGWATACRCSCGTTGAARSIFVAGAWSCTTPLKCERALAPPGAAEASC